jgi:TrmH family RNA methyltransferase
MMSKIISSREHALFKQLKVMTQGGARRKQYQQACLEGAHLAQAWLAVQGLPDMCITTHAALDNPEIAQLVRRVPPTQCVILSPTLFREISSLDQGLSILFLVTPSVAVLPDVIKQDCVILDRIQDPGNVGSILRSSAAAGVRLVLCTSGTAQVWMPKVLRAGMGAHFQLTIIEQLSPEILVSKIAGPILAAHGQANDVLYQYDLSAPIAWAFGNEGSGLDIVITAQAQKIAIPQPGGMESLNVAAAAAVCLFEMVRQRYTLIAPFA